MSMDADVNEQWKLDGKCNICRRKNYCSTTCKRYKSRRDYEMKCHISQALVRAFNKVMEE